MVVLLTALRIVLLLTFGIAGVAKLRDATSFQQTLIQFGVTSRWAGPVARALCVIELCIAIALAFTAAARYAAVTGLLLLLAFSIVVSYNLARGRRPACNCFGQMSSAPIGPATLVRNLALAAGAATLAVQGAGPTLGEWVSVLPLSRGVVTALGVLAPVVMLQAFLTLQVLQQQGRILRRLDGVVIEPAPRAQPEATHTAPGIGIGSVAPDFTLENLRGDTVSLQSLLARGPILFLVFMNPECGPCEALLPEVALWMQRPPQGSKVVVISEGSTEQNAAKGRALDPASVLLQREQEVANAYHAWGTPAALLIGTNGRVASKVAQGAEAIRSLLAEASTMAIPMGRRFVPAGRHVEAKAQLLENL